MSAEHVKAELAELIDPAKAAFYPKFFRAFKGGYGEGDKFLGVVVPKQRKVAKRYKDLSLTQIAKLVRSEFHEHRLTGFFILELQFSRADAARRGKIFELTQKHIKRIDNWDIVDHVAPKIIGPYLIDHPERKSLLYDFARARDLWKRRIAIIATLAFIRQGDFEDTLAIAEILVADEHDLIHKAVGWMLREVGNRDRSCEEAFLDRHAGHMPRTMLRYAIEKFPQTRRKHYMAK